MCVGKTGIAEIGIQKDKTRQYKDKNVVLDYVAPKEGQAVETQPAMGATTNDDLPF